MIPPGIPAPVWGAACLDTPKNVLLSAGSSRAAVHILTGILLVILRLPLGAEHQAKIVPGMPTSREGLICYTAADFSVLT